MLSNLKTNCLNFDLGKSKIFKKSHILNKIDVQKSDQIEKKYFAGIAGKKSKYLATRSKWSLYAYMLKNSKNRDLNISMHRLIRKTEVSVFVESSCI